MLSRTYTHLYRGLPFCLCGGPFCGPFCLGVNVGLLWLAPINLENRVLHSSTGKSFGCVCLDHIPSNINSYLASLHAVHIGITCTIINKYMISLMNILKLVFNWFFRCWIYSCRITMIFILTPCVAEGGTKLVSLHILYVRDPSFMYQTSCLSITMALISKQPDDPGAASNSCSDGAVQST
jgi:hypothetical protein